MRQTAIRAFDHLRKHPSTVSELADALDKNQGWISEIVAALEEQNLVRKDGQVEVTDTYEARLLADLCETYDAAQLLAGTHEDILLALADQPQTADKLQQRGFAQSTVYQALQDLRETGVVTESDGELRLVDDTLDAFLTARSTPLDEYTANGERISVNGEGEPTALSAFSRYGIDYYPKNDYRYQGERQLGRENVFLHAVLVAETKKQTAMTGIFYLKHEASLDTDELWRLAGKWDCVEKWADLYAYLDQREVKRDELFLPWEEFLDLAREYDVYPRNQYSGDSIETGLEELGETLETETTVYLLGGANLVYRDLKDSTKDIDVVVDDETTFDTVVAALRTLGYEERHDLERAYEKLDPSIVLETDGAPRWDIFVRTVGGQLQLTEEMRNRADRTEQSGDLTVALLSPTDIFLFKAITDREGDLEDVAVIIRQGAVEWEQMLDELETQEDIVGQYFSFSVLDTVELLDDRYDIDVPIHQRLVSRCLENALLVTLEEPKTIHDLRDEFDFPDHRLYNTLRKLEEEGVIEVDRTGKLNTYKLA